MSIRGMFSLGLRIGCGQRGVSIQDGQRVSEIDAGALEALVIAAGAWSGDVTVTAQGKRLVLPKTIPIKGHLIGFALDVPARCPRCGGMATVTCCNGPTGSLSRGRMRSASGSTITLTRRSVDELHARAAELWPTLSNHAPAECWIGFRPATEDLLPKIGRSEDTNVWLAYGHYRNGILLAPVTAQRIAASITSSLGRG